ncbi:MAG TPA: SsrA-binding protein SmpB [Candidatus Limnocylindrales bacterium]|nr:SsrA-binding protein SmpB [Candidatus Limnocylindrales bacterium]
MDAKDFKVITTNRKAYHDYFIGESVEAGIVLSGTEIKSIRAGSVNLSDAYVHHEKGELWVENMHIGRYQPGSYMSHEPLRKRKLLLHKKEIRNLTGKITQKGLTLIPVKLYIKNSRAKIEVALARGKKLFNKKDDLIKRDTDREMRRSFRQQDF